MHCSSFSRRLVALFFIIDSNDPSPRTAFNFFCLVVDGIGCCCVCCCCCSCCCVDVEVGVVNGDKMGERANGDIGVKSGLGCVEVALIIADISKEEGRIAIYNSGCNDTQYKYR